jgi:hypothetical protein
LGCQGLLIFKDDVRDKNMFELNDLGIIEKKRMKLAQ